MDILLVILGAVAMLAGIAGCVLPLLPGPPIAWLGLLLLHFSKYAHFSTKMLLIAAAITVVIMVADLLIPLWGTRRFGGTKAGQRGALIGMIAGLFIGPWGVILGPLAGAFVGEMIAQPGKHRRALRAALGSFAGFLLGTGIKLVWCALMAWWFLKALIG
jgi:uncharacterized protein YqgC (DUF456 family)